MTQLANMSASEDGITLYGYDQAEGKGWFLRLTWQEVLQLAKEKGIELSPSDLGRQVQNGVRQFFEK